MIYRVMINLIALVLFTTTAYALPQLEGVASDRLLSAEEKTQLRENLKGLISDGLTPIKNDYVNDYDRGTVEYNDIKSFNKLGREVMNISNYSYHKVVIPNGTIIKGVNFSQKNPHTNAISGKNLHFIGCNGTNVEVDPSWTFDGGLWQHSRHRIVNIDGETFDIFEIEKEGVFVEIERHKIIDN